MDKLKQAVGLDNQPASASASSHQSAHTGKEPVSGKSGPGTADQPFDQGNQENDEKLKGKSAGSTDPSKVAANEPTDDRS